MLARESSPEDTKLHDKPDIHIQDLQDAPLYSTVSVKAKVISVGNEVVLANGLKKQEVTIADTTAAAHLVLWEDDIDCVQEFQSYYFQGLSVRSFKFEKFLTKPKQNTTIQEIPDIGDVASDDLPQDSITLQDAEIIGIQGLQSYHACITCSSKTLPSEEEDITYCDKCDTLQSVQRCKTKISARLVLQHGEDYYTLSAFDDVLTTIAQSSNVEAKLLLSKTVTITFENNIITSVSM